METKQIMSLALGVALCALVLSAALIPAISMATDTEDTFTNEGYFRMSQYDDTTSHVVKWTYEKPTVITVDDEDVVIGYNLPSGQVTVVANSNWLLRMYYTSQGNVAGVAFLYGASGTKTATVENSQTATLTLTEGSASVVCGNYSGTHAYSIVYLPANDGTFTMTRLNEDNYINGDSPIYGFGLTRINTSTGIMGSPGDGFAFAGSYDDGITGSVWRGGDSATVSDCVCNVTKVNSYTDLYRFNQIDAVATLTETIDDETITTNTDLVYNIVIIPYQVTSELSIHADGPTRAILNMIPIIAVLGILIGIVAVGYIKFRN